MSARPPLSASVEPAATDFATRLARRAARIARAHTRANAQANAQARNADPTRHAARWRDAALLWPLFTED
ncbi:hypothetical protein [Tsuneonella suprasediminis]|uniref:hypothetical protein n=1 Tax=Tsuneonella suprasediminis TaxID=2306996 RepID=UPI002F932575